MAYTKQITFLLYLKMADEQTGRPTTGLEAQPRLIAPVSTWGRCREKGIVLRQWPFLDIPREAR